MALLWLCVCVCVCVCVSVSVSVCVSVCLLPSVGDVTSSAVVQRSKMEVALEGSAGTFNIIRLNLR